MDFQNTTETIIGVAEEAGEYVLAQFGVMKGGLKYDGTLVTEADGQSERMIRARLKVLFPEHTVFGEEMGYDGPEDNEWIWYLDPIDGTSNFVFGIPIWGVSIGLAHRGRPVLGVFAMPALRETFWAWDGGGAYLNGQRLAMNEPTEMRHTDLVVVASTTMERYDLHLPQKIRSLGCAAYALAGLAAGSFVGLIHDNWHLHDLAASIVMCNEVGLKLTTEQGEDFVSFNGIDPKAKAPLLVGAGPAVHETVLTGLVRKDPPRCSG